MPGFKLIKPHSIVAYKHATKSTPCCQKEGRQKVHSHEVNHTGQPQTHRQQVLITNQGTACRLEKSSGLLVIR
jgi:hypothetical protein